MLGNTHVYRCLVAEEPDSTREGPAHEPLVLPIRKKGKDGPSKTFANAASPFPSPSPSGARVAVFSVFSMTRTDVQDQSM